MRHWNLDVFRMPFQYQALFLPYLWGIETRLYPENRTWRILFLPYLWGIETIIDKNQHPLKAQKDFYPTYEALKRY